MEHNLEEKFVYFCNGKLEVREKDPFVKLLFSILGESFETTEKIISNIHCAISSSLLTVSQQEKEVLSLCFGLEDEMDKTEETVGLLLNLPKNAVVQLKDKALKAMKHSTNTAFLQGRRSTPHFYKAFGDYRYMESAKNTILSEIEDFVCDNTKSILRPKGVF